MTALLAAWLPTAPAAPGEPDFSAVVNFGRYVFGFVAYRENTCLLFGDGFLWLHLPSWAMAAGFLALAALEWWLLRVLSAFVRRRFLRQVA